MTVHIPWWQDQTSAETAARDKSSLVAILPLAAIEQHGGHLPLSTDLDINLGLLDATFARLQASPAAIDALTLPPLSVTASTEHNGFSGTLDIGPLTLIEGIRNIGRSLATCGVRRLVLCNSHGGNGHAAGIAALALRDEFGMLVVQADYFRMSIPQGLLPADELRDGLHGGALETSLMLALRPQAVRAGEIHPAATPVSRHVSDKAPSPMAWRAEDLAATGVIGNPALGSAAIGRTLVEHYAAGLADVIAATARRTLP